MLKEMKPLASLSFLLLLACDPTPCPDCTETGSSSASSSSSAASSTDALTDTPGTESNSSTMEGSGSNTGGEITTGADTSTTVGTTGGVCELTPPEPGSPWGPCLDSTGPDPHPQNCDQDKCIVGDKGSVCMPPCDGCAALGCGDGSCISEGCVPPCGADGECAAGMVCDTTAISGNAICVWPK